jgi:asparagine synthetase B (glutamine-hydrolysing)
MYSVTAHFTPNIPATAANVKARRVRQTPVETVRVGPDGRHLWIAGLPTAPRQDLNQLLGRAVDGTLSDAVHTLTSLDGAFAAFVWDPASRRLVVVTDFLGSQPLYMRRRPGELALAGTIRDLAAGCAPDPAGWGAFIGFGHFMGERTSATDVTRVGAATVLEYEPDGDRLSARSYWAWPDIDPRITPESVDTRSLLDLLTDSVAAYAAYGTDGTLLLSGGYESRLLAALLVGAGRRPTALTLRNPYEHLEIDGRFAARVARELDIPHVVRDPDPRFFSTDTFLEYVRLSDVATTSVNLFIAQVAAELQAAGVEASWDGVCYGTVIKDKSAPSFDAFVARALKPPESSVWRAARRVFAGRFVDEMWSEMRRTLSDEIARCHGGPAGVAELFVRNRARNRTTPNALKVYANFALPFMPGLTKAFYESAVPIPPAAKASDRLYRRILERHFPALARVPYCSGGHLLPGARPTLEYRLLAARSAIVEHPRMGNVLRRLGLTPARPPSAVVDDAVRAVDLDDPMLAADRLRELQRTAPSGAAEDTFARELVFYWSRWRKDVFSARDSGLRPSGAAGTPLEAAG